MTICVVYTLLSGGILLQGASEAMSPYGIPAATLASPHFVDAIVWVYTHMLVLGLITGLVGLTAESPRLKRWFARLLLAAHLVYLTLDTVHSDTALGNALYKGPQSAVPAVICFVMVVLLVHVAACARARDGHEPAVEPA